MTSKHVRTIHEEWYEVRVPDGISEVEADRILAELDVFFREQNGRPMTRADLMVTHEKGVTIYKFAGSTSSSGNDLHLEIYPNAVPAWSVVSDEKTWG